MLLNEDDVRRLLDPHKVLAAIEEAFRSRFSAVTIAPRLQIPLAHGLLLIMPCYDPSGPALGIKLVTVRNQPDVFQDRVQATYLLLDSQTNQPSLFISANWLTAVRTAATSAIATKYLSRKNAATLGVFGTGVLARAHLAIMPLVRQFRRILVCGREAAATAAFAEELSAKMHCSVEAVASQALATESDVLCTCTTSPTPLFHGRDLSPGAHINLVGAFQQHTREADTLTIQRAKVVVDTYEGARAEAGDILIPLREGAISENHILADLHELVSGEKQVRTGNDDITVFKSVGCALEDLAAAELLYSAFERS